MVILFDMLLIALVLGLAYALASEGLWGAALMFFNALFAGMIAFNFYEPLAALLDKTGINWGFSDTLCLLGLFCVSMVVLRLTTESLAPAMVRFPMPVYHAGRWLFAVAGAAVTISILLLGFECAPVHKKLFKSYEYNSSPPFHWGFDHNWLGFFQHATGGPFVQYGAGRPDPLRNYGQSNGQSLPIKLFDPDGNWLIDHQNARPYGDETVPPEEADDAGAGTAAPAAGGAGAPGAPGA